MKKYKKRLLIYVSVLLCILLISVGLIAPTILKSNVAVVETENFYITIDMMSYIINCELNEYVDYHELNVGKNYLQTVSLNPQEDLRKQESVYGSTWFDYFYDLALKKAKTILLSCEAAKNENVVLDKDEQKNIESTISKMNQENYDITEENLKKLLTYMAISDKYKEYVASKLTDADYNQFYKSNKKEYDCVDYKRVVINVDIDSEKSKGKNIEELTLDASKKAEKLLEEIKKNGFDKPVEKYLEEINSDDTIEDLTFLSERYVESTKFTQWAFDDSRKVGDAIIFPGKFQFSIYYMVKTHIPYDYILSDGTIVLGKYDSTNPTAITELKNKLEIEVKNDEDLIIFGTENGFGKIGLSKLYKDDLPEPICEWMYSNNRKAGDMDVCTYGENIYIMKYDGQGESYFKSKVESDCKDYEYTGVLKKLSKEINLNISEKFKFLILR